MKRLLALFLCGVLALGLAGCSEKEGEAQKTDGDTTQENQNEEKSVYEIGETAEVDGIKITVNSTRVDEGLLAAKDGKVHFVMDITLENTNDSEFASSSLLCYKVKNGDGREQSMSITANLNGTLDTKISAGEKASGEIAFETDPEGSLVLTFTPSFGDSVKFNVR